MAGCLRLAMGARAKRERFAVSNPKYNLQKRRGEGSLISLKGMPLMFREYGRRSEVSAS
jgi:hypothetical protein